MSPGGDGGADDGDEGEEVGFVHIEGGSDEAFEAGGPLGMGEDGGDDVDEIEGGGGEEESFEFFEAAFDDEEVNEEGGEGDGEEFVDMENFEGGGDAGEFGGDGADVGDEEDDHDDSCPAESEFFADEGGEAFTGDESHARSDFLGDGEAEGGEEEYPEE